MEVKTEDEGGAKKPSRPRLTERDLRLLSFLGEHGCVSPSRVKAYFWNSSQDSTAHNRRLRILSVWGYVEKVVGDQERLLGYRLTQKGKQFLKAQFPGQEVLLSRRGYKTPFEHDQRLIDVRKVLEQSSLILGFKMDHELRSEFSDGKVRAANWQNAQLVPDAVFTHRTPSGSMKIALELELTQKSKRRYGRIFKAHLLSRKWNLTLYLVKNEALRKSLMGTLEEIKRKDLEVRLAKVVNGIYFCSLEEFLLKGLETPMTNGKREISFAEMARKVEAGG